MFQMYICASSYTYHNAVIQPLYASVSYHSYTNMAALKTYEMGEQLASINVKSWDFVC
jgi:hypothetical protein